VVWNWLGAASIGPKPPALCSHEEQQRSDMTSRNGAEKLCRKRIDSTPRQTTTCSAARSRGSKSTDHPRHRGVAGHSTFTIARSPGRRSSSGCRTIRRPRWRAA
jgi:hypothetical protein